MKLDIVRAWKDDSYRQSLNEEQLATLPANPAGQSELTEDDLPVISGGQSGLGDVIAALNNIRITSIIVASDTTGTTCGPATA